MSNRKKPPTDEQRKAAMDHVQHLIANPPTKKRETKDWDDYRALDSSSVEQIRRLACKVTSLTMEQLIAAEKEVSHPREIIPVMPSPRTLTRRRMNAAGVPERHIQNVADREPLHCDAMAKVRGFLNSRLGFLVLSGGKGTRKTGSACWALGQAEGGAFLEAGSITRLSINERTKWDQIARSKFIVLDDLGTEKRDGQGAFLAAFFELFNGVYSECRRMIVTCNLTAEQFRAEPDRGGYGGRVYDRLRETGAWSEIGGESVRGQDRIPGEDDE